MKSRKVQAQRKFAQGAYIHPQLPTPNNLERATQQSPNKEERSIVHPNVAAAFSNVDVISSVERTPVETESNITKAMTNKKEEITHRITRSMKKVGSQEPKPVQKRKGKKRTLSQSSSEKKTKEPKLVQKKKEKQKALTQSSSKTRTKEPKLVQKKKEKQKALTQSSSKTRTKEPKPVQKKKALSQSPSETRSKVTTETNGHVSNSGGPSTSHSVFLDVHPHDSPHVIELTPENIQDDNKRMMSARLTPKALASTTQDFSAVENEPILGSILQTLNLEKENSGGPSTSHSVFLDVHPHDSPHVIELTPENIQDDNKRMMSARLTPKALASTTQDFSAVENEPILGSILQTLNLEKENSGGPSTSHSVFLDVHPHDSPHVIELTPENIQDDNKRMMSARLTPKALASTKQNFSAVENEPILGSILQTLNLEKENEFIDISEDSSDSVVIKEEIPSPAKKHESTSLLYSLNKDVPLEAPTYYPTEDEFYDPIAFFERIAPVAAKYGICKIVAPPNYKPKCVLDNDINFHVTNQYIGRMYNRWGPAMREMCAIKAYLASQNVHFRSPLMDHLELNLPKLHRLVQGKGGLSQVLEMKEWKRVAEEMRIRKTSGHQSLDSICMKTLLPYDTLSTQERQQLLAKVENGWNKKNLKLMQSVINPLHRQRKLLGESDCSEEESEEDVNVAAALKEAEDCITKGTTMTLTCFKKVASNATDILLGPDERTCSEIEKEYWSIVLLGTEHVCVNTASIDTGKCGYGFSKTDKHPWNLKMVSQNSGNVLRSLGMVLGATVPTLHLGMVYSTSCWHRDPHGLPWLEYMHTGPPKIWYGIPDEQSANFRKAVENLCPTSWQNKSIWLPSDITMIPPDLLRSHGVALARVEQKPREYIMVFPKAYSCSISTGYTVSESVYFANNSWLKDVEKVFQELRESCEPTIFSLEQLLMSLAKDTRSKVPTLLLVRDTLAGLVAQETFYRNQLQKRSLTVVQDSGRQRGAAADSWNEEECEVCRTALLWSKVTLKGRKSAVCLKHGLRLLETPRTRGCEVSEMELVTMLSLKQLEEAVQSLFARTAMS